MIRQFALILALSLSGCAGDSQSERSTLVDAGSYSFVDAPITSDEGGVVTADLVPQAGVVRVVKASSKSRIAKVKAEFFPGAFDYETEVSISESPWHVAAPGVLTELKLPNDHYIQAIGTPVLIEWTYDENTANDYRLYIPDVVPASTANDNLVVFYKINLPDSSEFNVGVIPASKLSREEGLITLAARSYGIFQAAILSEAVATASEELSTKPIDTGVAAEVNGPPAPFAVVTDQIKAKSLHNASLRLVWNPSGGATSFKIALDDDDANCKSPVKTIADLKVISTLVPTLEGQNYICVYAVNAHGQTPASNNGKLSFLADATIPAVPTGLKSTVSGINVKVQWNPAEDKGSAGFAFYELQIGTTINGVEQFNGPIPTDTSYEFSGFSDENTSYYARVRTVDKAGNVSAWSKTHGPITRD